MDIKRFMAYPLYEVIQHRKTGWLLDSDVSYDMREIAMIASDMRILAGRAGYTLSREANALCKELLPVAARRIKNLGMQMFIWEDVSSKEIESERLEGIRSEFLSEHPEGSPTQDEIKAISKRLNYFAEHFGEELLLSEVKDDHDFAEKLSETLLVAAVLIEAGIAWMTCIITNLPGVKTIEVAPETLKEIKSEDKHNG